MMVALCCTAMLSGAVFVRRLRRPAASGTILVMIVALDRGFSHDQRLPKRHLKALGALFLQVSEVVRDGRAGQTRPCRAGWHEDQSERVET